MRPRSKSGNRTFKTDRIEATIEELAPGGAGVAITSFGGERRAIFVRHVAVGDRVALDVDFSRRPAPGRVLELVSRGPDRVDAPCPHTARCGGCDWMHVSPAGQRTAHEAHVLRALPEAWRTIAVAWHAAPKRIGARGRARLHVRASGGRAIVGMNEVGTNEPVEVDACIVLEPALDRGRGLLGPLLEGAHGRGDAQIALGTGGLPVLELRWSGALPAEFFGRMERAIAAKEWAGARVLQGEAKKHASIGDPTPWMRGADDAPLMLAPGGFAQASEETNAILAKRVAALAAETGAQRIVELYSGAGNLSVMLASSDRELVSVESDRGAVDAARANLTLRHLPGRVVEADASVFPIPPPTQLLVLDPPRTGARAVAEALLKRPVRHVIYVSCDPQTLGRDLAILAGARYFPRAIELFEMFPNTSHVETVIALERNPPTRPPAGQDS